MQEFGKGEDHNLADVARQITDLLESVELTATQLVSAMMGYRPKRTIQKGGCLPGSNPCVTSFPEWKMGNLYRVTVKEMVPEAHTCGVLYRVWGGAMR